MTQKLLLKYLVVSTFLIGGILILSSSSASAAVPPDNCFTFDVATGTISEYLEYQDSDPASPACPKDVTIPSVINGVSVTILGDYSFQSRGITAVSIPNSVTSIGEGVFINNQISVLPDYFSRPGVTTISESAFSENALTSLAIPSTLLLLSHLLS